MIDTLLFDLDNTLLDFDKAEANAITRALGDVGISVTNEMRDCYHKINLAQWKLLEQGKMTREEVKMRRFKLLFQEFDIKASPQEVAKHYQDYLGQGHYFIEGAEEVLQELSKRFRIYLVTNGTLSVQRGRLKSSGLRSICKVFLFPRKLDITNQALNILRNVFLRFQILRRRTQRSLETA